MKRLPSQENSPAVIARMPDGVTHNGYWTRLYVRGLDPDEGALTAAREYDATHRPDWARTRR
jgi:hypothetical protein